jgi:hypothetical protein
VTIERCLGVSSVVQAVETKSLLGESLLGLLVGSPAGLVVVRDGVGEATLALVTGDHLEALREGSDLAVGVGSVIVEEVVSKHTTNLLDHLGSAVGVEEVDWGSPVGRLVLSDGT